MELLKYFVEEQALSVAFGGHEPLMENVIIAAVTKGHLQVLQYLDSLDEVTSLFDETLSVPRAACKEGQLEILDYLLKKDEDGLLRKGLSVRTPNMDTQP